MHHVRKAAGRRAVEQTFCGACGGLVLDRITVGDLLYEVWLCGGAAVCDRAHIGHILTGVDLVRILADAGPCQLGFRRIGDIKASGGRRRAVKAVAARDADLLGIAHQRLWAELRCDLAENDVAGMGQRLFKVQRAVHAVALDGLAADDGAALAGERPGSDIRDLIQRGCSRDELEDGARRIGSMQEAVDIHALIGLGAALHVRHIVRVVGWGGDGAENLARLVIIDADGSLAPVERGQRRALHVCAYGQHHPALALAGGIGAVDAVKSDKLRTVFLQQERRDIALTVAEQVQHAAAQRGTVGIGLAVRGIEHDGTAAVDDLAAVHNAVRIDMGAVLERDPVR